MPDASLTVSVIIPTHNRSATLRRTLDSVRTQTYPPGAMEVVVVADGCTDGTAEMVRHYEAPFALRVIEQPGQGPAAARNNGAAHATGQLLVFLDDDVEPTGQLVEAHVGAHEGLPGCVVIGPYLPVQGEITGFHGIELRKWWEDEFRRMDQPGHRYSYRDLLSGNLSLEAELFSKVGGFDPAFWVHEDYELGVRLIKADVPFTFAAGALGHHYLTVSLKQTLDRERQAGRADVMIGHRHPELRSTLPLASLQKTRSSVSRILRSLAFWWPTLGDRLAAGVGRALRPVEKARLRGAWRRLCGELCNYWYWRGVAEELESRRALAGFLRGDPEAESPEIEIDLCQSLEVAGRRLDEERPAAARIRYGQQPVGRIPALPGGERLRGAHLRYALTKDLAIPFLKALALEAETAGDSGYRSALPAATGVDAWIRDLGGEKAWREDQRNQWQRWRRLGGEARTFWELLARIRELEPRKARAEAQWEQWRGEAEERGRIWTGQRARIRELERRKARAEAQWEQRRGEAEERGRIWTWQQMRIQELERGQASSEQEGHHLESVAE